MTPGPGGAGVVGAAGGEGEGAKAEAVDGRCSQCHMAMRLQFFQDLKHSGEVMHCESCSRILYYNPPETFENLTGETAPAARG